jgi:hypothetical protein
MAATPTTIYINPRQRKRLFDRARKRKTSFSEELRSAVDLYLELPPGFDGRELGALAEEAKASMDRSAARLDAAIARLRQATVRLDNFDRRLDELK